MSRNIPPTVRSGFVWLGLGLLIAFAPAITLIFSGSSSWRLTFLSNGWTMVWMIPFAVWSLRLSKLAKRIKAYPAGLCCRCEYPLPAPIPPTEAGPPPLVCSECGCTLSRAEHEKAWRRWIDVRFKV